MRARGSGLHNQPFSLPSLHRGPYHPARFPGPGLPLPAAAPVHGSSPSCRTHLPVCRGLHAPGSLGVGSRHLAFASLQPHLPTLPPPPKRRITSGKVAPNLPESRACQLQKLARVCNLPAPGTSQAMGIEQMVVASACWFHFVLL
ncbi:hypothetical protein A6R68_06632 [Neotoma lepida]|uniref:Uncharacterized protein n=1 Tax=Neotoma lepida TaxID=56216 RepID=A0A1A6GHR5_NEOLE|nr:hypothetical protein A6R68_06632 [Neotoma lepida]